jgi:TRAP-type C4-dicarboxylate transport system permease large subunit
MKIVIVIALVAIVAALASAGVFMMREGRDGQANSGKMMRALAWRVGLSVLLFVCILGAYRMGWIQPTGVPLGR